MGVECNRCKYGDICIDAFRPVAKYCSGNIDYDVDEEGDDEEEEYNV